MSAFCEDHTRWNEYFHRLVNPSVPESDLLTLRLFEWFSNENAAPKESLLDSAAALIDRDSDSSTACSLRVVVLPYNARCRSELVAFKAIFEHYEFTSSSLSERITAVTHSFGTKRYSARGIEVAWSHFLCKGVAINWKETGSPIVDHFASPSLNPENMPWIVADFHLHVLTRSDGSKCVTLLLFGAPDPIISRFQRLLGHPTSWRDVLEEPLLLFLLIGEELYYIVDRNAWELAEVFRPMEKATLQRAAATNSTASNEASAVDFTGLHVVSKHITYLNEAVEAALQTLDNMLTHVRHTRGAVPDSLPSSIVASLTYRRYNYLSTQLRLHSLEKRMANVISLSFNLVTQQDSRVMQNDSQAMKAIAILSLIFLPATGISSVFSTPFFAVDFGSQENLLQVAKSFWIFWALAIPLTFFLCGAWLVWYRDAKLKRTGNLGVHKRRHFADLWHKQDV